MMIDGVKNSFIFSFQKNHNVDRPGLPLPPAPNIFLYYFFIIFQFPANTFFLFSHSNNLYFIQFHFQFLYFVIFRLKSVK